MFNNNKTNDNTDNEFMNIDLQQSQMKGSRSMPTDMMLDKLQQKNNLLKKQVNKIDRVLSSIKMEEKPRYGVVLPEIKPDAIKKQLENAYKQIKIYEYQIEKRRNMLNSESAYVQQINKIQKVYKQKVQIHERLKREMILIKNESKQLIKNLKNNNKKIQYENKQIKLSTDVKYLQEKLREYEMKRGQHIGQLEKQRIAIKEMQQEMLKENSIQFIQGIKMRIFKPDQSQHNNLSPSRSIFEIENDAVGQQSRMTKTSTLTILNQTQEEKTVQLYQSIQNDIRLLKKMQNDYESKMSLIVKEKDEAADKNFKARNKVLEVEFEIENVERSILELKKIIDPRMLKPLHMQPVERKKEVVKRKGPSISHSFQFIEVGEITKNGKRFSDRAVIGKKNSRMVGVTLFQKIDSCQFVGIQVVYEILNEKYSIKKGNLNLLLDPKKQQLKQENIELYEGDFFKTIDLFMKKGKILGISMNSQKNKIIKIGDMSGQRKILQMKQSQYPMCIFGSILRDGFECFGVETSSTSSNDKNELNL